MERNTSHLFNRSLFNDIFAGTLSGFIIVIIATVFTALIFKGPLSAFFSIGITCALIGSCLVNAITAIFSDFRFGIARPEPAIGVILAIMFANIASNIVSSDSLIPTLICVTLLTSLMIGIVMLVMGHFRWGQIARFLPYPVLCGIIASMGWFMAVASFSIMKHQSFHFYPFFHSEELLQYLIWLGFGIYLISTAKQNAVRPWLMPISIFIMSLIINLILKLMHISHDEAIQQGWLFSSFKPEFIFKSINISTISLIDWPAIYNQIGYFASSIGILVIILLFNVSSLESAFMNKVDLEHELKICGISNVFNSFLAGVPCNLSFSGTLLNKNAGATNRISGIIASAICLIVLFIYPEAISYFPKPIIAGLLLYTAISLLYDWLLLRWNKLPYVDYSVVLSIFVVAAAWGFLPGVITGLVITCISFIIRYARIDAIKFNISNKNYRSNVLRPPSQQNWLLEHGDAIQIFKLQGYIFFGSTKLLLDNIMTLIDKDTQEKLRYLIFDFQSVSGIDSSASYSFMRLKQITDQRQIQLIFSHCSPKLLHRFKQQQVIDESSHVMSFQDLDQALEWCEEKLLISANLPLLEADDTAISNTLNELVPDKDQLIIFKQFLEKITLPNNFVLFKQGDSIDALYFIASGQVSVHLESNDTRIRVSKSGPGTIVGEIGVYLCGTRTATVITESPCIVYKLSQEALQKLEKIHPEVALLFHKSVIRTLALRVVQTNYELKLLFQ